MAEAVHVPVHLEPLGSPKAKQLSHLQLSEPCSTLTGEELPQAKKVLHLCMQGHFGCVQQFATLWTMACQASLFRGFSRQECWSRMPYPSRVLYFLAANSSEYLVLPEPLRPKQLHHLHTWTSQRQTQVLQGRLRSKPQWTTHM